MSAPPVEVPIDLTLGPISITVRCPKFPQSIAALVWHYSSAKQKLGLSGEVHPPDNSVPLGNAAVVKDHYFLIDGAVIANPGGPPTPFQIVVTVMQADKPIHSQVPPDGGTGTIDAKDMPFIYRFRLV